MTNVITMNTAQQTTQAPAPTQAAAIHVYQAINAIQAEMSQIGIAKNNRNAQQGYNFRGIDDIFNALAPMLARNGLVIIPQMLERQVVEKQTQRGGNLFYVTVKVQYDFISAQDGSRHSVVMYGEAMDSGDKATNKAMSAAYKYAALQVFCIPTSGDNDADGTTHHVIPNQPPQNHRQQAPQPNYHQNDYQGRAQQQNPVQHPSYEFQKPPANNQPPARQAGGGADFVLNRKQIANLRNAIQMANLTEEQFCRSGNIPQIEQLTQSRLSPSLQWLKRKATQ